MIMQNPKYLMYFNLSTNSNLEIFESNFLYFLMARSGHCEGLNSSQFYEVIIKKVCGVLAETSQVILCV